MLNNLDKVELAFGFAQTMALGSEEWGFEGIVEFGELLPGESVRFEDELVYAHDV